MRREWTPTSRGFLCILSTSLLLACSATVKEPRLVLLYMPCTLSREFLEPYEPSTLTPNFQRLADEGVVFFFLGGVGVLVGGGPGR